MRSYPVHALLLIPILSSGSTLDAQAGLEAEIRPWPLASRAAVSVTFDDAYYSHVRLAMPLLESHGLRGTFYLIVDKILRRGKYRYHRLSAAVSEWQAAASRGT